MLVNFFIVSFLFLFEIIFKLYDGEIICILVFFFNFVGIIIFIFLIEGIFRFKKYFII